MLMIEEFLKLFTCCIIDSSHDDELDVNEEQQTIYVEVGAGSTNAEQITNEKHQTIYIKDNDRLVNNELNTVKSINHEIICVISNITEELKVDKDKCEETHEETHNDQQEDHHEKDYESSEEDYIEAITNEFLMV